MQSCTCFKRQKLNTQAKLLVSHPYISWQQFSKQPFQRRLRGIRTAQYQVTTPRSKLKNDSVSNVKRWSQPKFISELAPARGVRASPKNDDSVQNLITYRSYSSKNGVDSPKTVRVPPVTMKSKNGFYRAVVAFGSNIGNRIAHIENALKALRQNGITILRLSRLYETKAMYVENQPSFLNGAVAIETQLEPLALLDLLQKIELDQGRERKIEKGPRTLDLDIILYGHENINHERLKVPHLLMMEREFVLRPVADVLSDYTLAVQPPVEVSDAGVNRLSIYQALCNVTNQTQPMYPVTQLFSRGNPIDAATTTNQSNPYVMSILNITPDSFSDGGRLMPSDIETIVATAKSHISSGARILDIGGQSTRPNATLISADEELGRVLPALEALREIPEVSSGYIAISLDTFYASVARTCADRGLIDIVNDISAGLLDEDMLKTVAIVGKPIILMHMRGTPQTMSSAQNTNYSSLGGVVPGVAYELAARVVAALEAGIPPWRIILDPGLGFAKTMNGNLELLKAGPKGIVSYQPEVLGAYPWLVGPSRKGFIGKITGVNEAKERVWGTAACVTAAVTGGADVVRVHDVKEMASVVKMAQAITVGHFGSIDGN